MRGIVVSIIIGILAFLILVITFLTAKHRAKVTISAEKGPYVDVVKISTLEDYYRNPLDQERSYALERALYYVGSFGGWYNTSGAVPNLTNPWSFLPEPLLFIWRKKGTLFIPSLKNVSHSMETFLLGYYSYANLKRMDPSVYMQIYPITLIRPELLEIYPKVNLGNETKVVWLGRSLRLKARIGESYGYVEFYPMITARSRASVIALYNFGSNLTKDISPFQQRFESSLEELGGVNVLVPLLIHNKGDYVEKKPKYDWMTALMVYNQKFLREELGIQDIYSFLDSIGCSSEFHGQKYYRCNSSEIPACDESKCKEIAWKVLKYLYYRAFDESSYSFSSPSENRFFRTIPIELNTTVKVWKEVP